MKRKNLTSIVLIAVASIVVGFILVNNNNRAEYQSNQTAALTHEIAAVGDYESPYVGDASNVSQLFYHLPLNNIPMKFQIASDTNSLTVYYLDTVFDIGRE